MVRISKRTRSRSRSHIFKSRWLLSISLALFLGLTGTLTIMNQKNPEKNDTAQPLVAAISAASIKSSGKPYLLYGTAWKKDATAGLVHEAIRSGFRFIDTACQPKHYNEPGVGEGIVAAMKELGLSRSDLFIQTKFTSIDGQDPNNIPYDKHAPLEDQVLESFNASLRNLRTTYIDSLVLHSPMRTHEKTMIVWRVLEKLVDEGMIRQLGISNCYDPHHFKMLYNDAKVKPSVLQNRFYADSGFDVELREFCAEKGILYQSFWTLTSQTTYRKLRKQQIKEMAEKVGLTPQTLMYAYMMKLGHTPLCGTTNKEHMLQDVAVMERIQGGEEILTAEDIDTISDLLGIGE